MKKILFLTFLFFTYAVHSEIFKWIDSQGSVHFSDTPHPGAEKLNIPVAQDIAPSAAPAQPALPVKPPPSEPPSKMVQLQKEPVVYKKLAIVEPQDGETIRNNQGATLLRVHVEPRLAPNVRLQLFLDGEPFGKPQANLGFDLIGINKGAHTFNVKVIDSKGTVLISSQTITLYFQRARIGMAS